MKKLVKISCIILSLMICIMQACMIDAAKTAENTVADWPKSPNDKSIVAESAILMDVSSGLVLYKKNADKKQYPASITKIMTTLLAIENSSLDEIVIFSKKAVFGIEPGSSHIGVEVGEKLTMEQCLYAMMLESANEVCLGVAEHVAGSIDGFVKLMNERAKELGCKNTHFMNPNGLHNDKHYTTANDMALIAQAAIKNNIFRKVTGTKQYTIPKTNKKKEARTWIKNHNQMLNGYKYPKYEYKYCIGGKTGYTMRAQSTLVTYGEKKGITLVTVVLKDLGPSYSANEYTDSTKLLNYGFHHFKTYDVANNSNQSIKPGLFTKYSALLNSNNPLIYVAPGTKITIPKSVSFDAIEQNFTYNAPTAFQQGENIIGTITYFYDGKQLGTGSIIYNLKDITQLNTKSEINKAPANKPISKKSGPSTNKIVFITAICTVAIGCFYYGFIARKRRQKHNCHYVL